MTWQFYCYMKILREEEHFKGNYWMTFRESSEQYVLKWKTFMHYNFVLDAKAM